MKNWQDKNPMYEIGEKFNINEPNDCSRDLNNGFYLVYFGGKDFLLDTKQKIGDKRKYCLIQAKTDFRFHVKKEEVFCIKRKENGQSNEALSNDEKCRKVQGA